MFRLRLWHAVSLRAAEVLDGFCVAIAVHLTAKYWYATPNLGKKFKQKRTLSVRRDLLQITDISDLNLSDKYIVPVF